MHRQPATSSSHQPLGTGGDLRSRLLYHHAPLAFASAVALVVFMHFPIFDANAYPHADIFSGAFPQQRAGDPTQPMEHGPDHAGRMRHSRDGTGLIHRGDDHAESNADQTRHRSFNRQLTVATGYVALALLALTLLVGPANLLLGRRNPVSNYLSRDIGTWAAISGVVHAIVGLQVHGRARIRDFLDYFVGPDGSPWTNSFGLANWTGLAAVMIVVGLLAISSDAALRKLKAKAWKRLQRLNYALFALVILHAFFYGAVLRVTSPYTLVLGLTVIAVFVGQAVGIRRWRRSKPRGLTPYGQRKQREQRTV